MSTRARGTRSRNKSNSGTLKSANIDVEIPAKVLEEETNGTSGGKPSTRTGSRRSPRASSAAAQEDATAQMKNRDQENTTFLGNGHTNNNGLNTDKVINEGEPADKNKDDDFMRSEHFPKISSRVGAKYQAVVPPFAPDEAATTITTTEANVSDSITDSTSSVSSATSGAEASCIWSPNNSLMKKHDERGENGINTIATPEAGLILDRYLAQAQLIMSKFYQSHLNVGHNLRLPNLLSSVPNRSKGTAALNDNDISNGSRNGNGNGKKGSKGKRDRDSDSDYENSVFSDEDEDEDNSSSEVDEFLYGQEAPPRPQHKKKTLKVEQKRGRPRNGAAKGYKQRPYKKVAVSTSSTRNRAGDDVEVDPNEPVIDGSFIMISSCLEDFLLELLHKSDYHPAKALHFLALITTPPPSSSSVPSSATSNGNSSDSADAQTAAMSMRIDDADKKRQRSSADTEPDFSGSVNASVEDVIEAKEDEEKGDSVERGDNSPRKRSRQAENTELTETQPEIKMETDVATVTTDAEPATAVATVVATKEEAGRDTVLATEVSAKLRQTAGAGAKTSFLEEKWLQETLQWVHGVVERNVCVLTKEEQILLGNAHNKHAYNLNKIVKSIPSNRKNVAINYSFRFLFVSSDLLEVELPSMDGNKNGSINANNNQNTLNRNDTSPMSGSSSSSSLTSLVPSEMVTRASIRAERKLRQKASSDIYYFPSPSDKGKYPVGTSYQVDDRGSASKETMMTERDSLRVLIRMRQVLDSLSFRQFMNSFALFADGVLSPIDMAVRLRYIFESFLEMNFPLALSFASSPSPSSSSDSSRSSPMGAAGEEERQIDTPEPYLKRVKLSSEDTQGEGFAAIGNDANVDAGDSSDSTELTSQLYISNTKKLHNDFLVNFFPLHVSYWREMK